jgi:very-short-patch-repair endonuclease/DNA polymerase III delta prime subunit
MQESILSKLEASRRELLDLGLRNPLLNYRLPVSRGVHLEHEKVTNIYEVLVKQGKAMTFLPKPSGKDLKEQVKAPEEEAPIKKDEDAAEPLITEPEEVVYDTKLQTGETTTALQNRLLNTYYAARTSMEEQGVNILFLTLGILEWYEKDNGKELRRAPLILIPVSLERSSARERFRLKYTGSEVETNLSLQTKIKAEYGIALPGMPETEDIDVEAYIKEVDEAIHGMSGWKVITDTVDLGFFSFGKLMLYHDLDSDLWPSDEQPADHPILKSLFGNGFHEGAPAVDENAFIDTETNAHQLHQVVDADGSQLLAMLAVQEGRNLVIQGPPGTGKSQTITNLIANAVGEGKKVLFVAEKMAALEVVKRRLDSIQMGEACLELHSHKANKKELHQELRRTLELGKPAILQLQQEVTLLDEYREELNDYCLAVNSVIGASGVTPQQVMGYLLQLKDEFEDMELPRIIFKDLPEWDAARMQRAESLATRIAARITETGIPSSLLFWGSQLTVLSPAAQEALTPMMQDAEKTTKTLQHEGALIAGKVGLPMPLSRKFSMDMAFLLQLASIKPDLSHIRIKHPAWLQQKDVVREMLDAGKRFTQIRKVYESVLIPEAWEQEVLDIRQNLLAYGDKWYKFTIGDYNHSNRRLAALCRNGAPDHQDEKLACIDAILESRRLEKQISDWDVLGKDLFGQRWQRAQTNWESLESVVKYMSDIYQQINIGSCSPVLLDYLEKNEPASDAKEWHDAMMKYLQQQGAAVEKVVNAVKLNEQLRYREITPLLQRAYEDQLVLLQSWIAGLPEIHQVIAWNNLAATAVEENLQPLADAVIYWPQADRGLKGALQKTWYEYLWEQALLQHAPLRQFERSSHEATVKQFTKLDILNQQYNRARAALKHWDGVPPLEAGGQVNVLRTEFNKKARHMPIRKLMQSAGLAIQAIKPVFMMSPLSIANYLPPGALHFDLVIFDEASQVRPVDALGALLRGKQLVVVGDSKQLPPSSFFDSLLKEVDDEENVTADMPSILGMCDAQGAPQRMLRWHYRSRHESLITLSNQEFYENKLVIFPSPGADHKLGLVYHHLKDATYDRGKTRTNQKEADAITEAVIEHARNTPQLSLGVVAFSTAQMQAIQLSLEAARKKMPELESFFKAHPHEPFFVKNLENVQGDERDVIFISIGYGRTPEGTINLSFGPLNNEGGERRLNVLITRAKQRCEVFTNLTADDIDVNKTESEGVRALKEFLHYAQHGNMQAVVSEEVLQKTPFEEQVADHLIAAGYTVHRQVGNKGFYIDLAIVDPENPAKYLIGITCDGAAYNAARSARDRDRLRQQVLEEMGWKIYRVWSTDWFRHPARELRRLLAAIDNAKGKVTNVQVEDDADGEEEDYTMVREAGDLTDSDVPLYTLATLPEEISKKELHQHPMEKIQEWLEKVVEVESPVHTDEVTRRIIEAAGVSRVGSRIREILKQAITFARNNGSILVKESFLWDAQMQQPLLRSRANLPAASRRLLFISPEEIRMAVVKVVQDAVAITAEAAIPLIAKTLGFPRLTEELKNDLSVVLQQCIEDKLIVKDDEWLKA